MTNAITRYVEWMKELKARFYQTPSKKRVEKPTQKSIEGTALRPEQDVVTDE